jgi:archaellum component FlaC
MCLASRKATVADEGDIQALERVRIDIEKQLDRLGKVRKSNDGIRSNVEKIEKEIQMSEKELGKLLSNAEKTLCALNVELVNEAEEVKTPIRLSSMPPGRW